MQIRPYRADDLPAMAALWNAILEEGDSFPGEEPLSLDAAGPFFAEQSAAAVAERGGRLLGLYVLHPNNIGRCGHLCNASYAVASAARGQRVGERLVTHCLAQASLCGFRILQFNAVVATNERARRLYERLGFVSLGTIPGGFLMKDGHYEDICLYYHEL